MILDLVYNRIGAFLPASQQSLESDFKKKLWDKYQLRFNKFCTLTNMPIHRFKEQLHRLDAYEEYMKMLVNVFNPIAANGIICCSLLSVLYDGKIFDCDFNQMLGLQVFTDKPMIVFDFDYKKLVNRKIIFDSRCFGCTAGAGSSCGGAIAE